MQEHKYAGTQIAKEMATFYVIGQIESALAMDIGFTAVTSFGAWYGAEILGALIGWCE